MGYNVIKLSPYSHLISARSYDYILGKKEFLKDPSQLFWGNFKAILIWIYSYQTVIPSLLFFLGLALLIRKNWQKAFVFLSWLIVPILGSAAIGKIIFPRYFLFIQPWIIIFIAYGLAFLTEKTKTKTKKLSIILIFPWLVFSGLIVFNPVKAPLIEREQNQYLTSWAAGYGIKEIAQYLKKDFEKDKKAYVATEGFFGTLPDGLQVYLDGFGNIEVFGIGQPIGKIHEDILQKAKEKPTFLVVNDTRFFADRIHLDLIKEYPKPEFPFLKESLLFFKVKPE